MTDSPAPDTGRTDTEDAATRVFVDHRELAFSLVYSMLGSVADTEDVLQETWLAWAARSGAPGAPEIESPRAYLVRIAVNKALAKRTEINKRRETYFGPWLPEPLVTAVSSGPDVRTETADSAESVERTEAVSMALLVVLETLTPLERAVFVLHEVFGYAHTETAAILGRTPAAVRQLAHRSREHVEARRPRYRTDPRISQEVTERFVAAAFGGDLGALLELLAPEVTLWADGGGRAPAAGRQPMHGRDKVAKLLVARTARPPAGLEIRYERVNGAPAALVYSAGSLFSVLAVDLTPEGDRIRGVFSLTNPDKFAGIE